MVKEPDVIKFHADVGGDMMPGNSKSLRELLIKQTELWHQYVKIAKIEPIS